MKNNWINRKRIEISITVLLSSALVTGCSGGLKKAACNLWNVNDVEDYKAEQVHPSKETCNSCHVSINPYPLKSMCGNEGTMDNAPAYKAKEAHKRAATGLLALPALKPAAHN